MFWLTILAAIISGLSAQAIPPPMSDYTIRDLRPDEGWVQFRFGQVGEPPYTMLRVLVGLMAKSAQGGGGNMPFDDHGMKKCYLEITDAFCPGDNFELIELGNGSTGPQTILRTPKVGFNKEIAQEICDGFPVQCPRSTNNPDVAFNDSLWSSGKILLGSGEHSIVIKPINSPYCSGAGFVRVRCIGHRPPHPHPHPHPHPQPTPKPEALCKYSEGGFRMVMKSVQGPNAGSVCTSLGMKLAEIDNSNFVASTNVAFKCSGPLSTSWIGAWNGQTWAGQEGLGLTVSTASPGGSINVYNDGKMRNVLCQEI
jgi:hypothetical protein